MTILIAASGDGAGDGAAGLALVVVMFALYWIPAIVAFARHHHNRGSILVINMLLGWTFIGWVVALAMSVGNVQSKPA